MEYTKITNISDITSDMMLSRVNYMRSIVEPNTVITYKDFCKYLYLNEKTGNTKITQLKDISLYIDYKKVEGKRGKFLIQGYYDKPNQKTNNVRLSKHNTFLSYILIDYFNKKNKKYDIMTKKEWWKVLGFVNNNYLEYRSHYETSKEYLDYLHDMNVLNNINYKTLALFDNILYSRINKIYNKLIYYIDYNSNELVEYANDAHNDYDRYEKFYTPPLEDINYYNSKHLTFIMYIQKYYISDGNNLRVATADELSQILSIQRSALVDMGKDTIDEIYAGTYSGKYKVVKEYQSLCEAYRNAYGLNKYSYMIKMDSTYFDLDMNKDILKTRLINNFDYSDFDNIRINYNHEFCESILKSGIKAINNKRDLLLSSIVTKDTKIFDEYGNEIKDSDLYLLLQRRNEEDIKQEIIENIEKEINDFKELIDYFIRI